MALRRDDEGVEMVTPGWRFVHIGFEADSVEIGGARLRDVDWGDSRGTIVVAHPQYPDQRHTMRIYRARAENHQVEFAAGEFSNGVWCFFEPADRHGN